MHEVWVSETGGAYPAGFRTTFSWEENFLACFVDGDAGSFSMMM